MLSIDRLLQEFPAIILDKLAALHIVQGQSVANPSDISKLPEGNTVRLYDHQQQFLGLGEITSEQKIAAKRMLASSQLLKAIV